MRRVQDLVLRKRIGLVVSTDRYQSAGEADVERTNRFPLHDSICKLLLVTTLVFLVEFTLNFVPFSTWKECSNHLEIGTELTYTLMQWKTNQHKNDAMEKFKLPRRSNQSPARSKPKYVSSCAKMLS